MNHGQPITIDVVVGDFKVMTSECLLGIPVLHKKEAIIDCKAGLMDFKDDNGDIQIFGKHRSRISICAVSIHWVADDSVGTGAQWVRNVARWQERHDSFKNPIPLARPIEKMHFYSSVVTVCSSSTSIGRGTRSGNLSASTRCPATGMSKILAGRPPTRLRTITTGQSAYA